MDPLIAYDNTSWFYSILLTTCKGKLYGENIGVQESNVKNFLKINWNNTYISKRPKIPKKNKMLVLDIFVIILLQNM
jgi:hypothetical protein